MRVKGWGWWALLCAEGALAQAPAPLQDPGQHSVRMVRTTTPPVIDGKLDDAAWATAALVDNLHQTSPIEYAVPEERSEIYLLYDDETLYVGARLYDPEPDKITANNSAPGRQRRPGRPLLHHARSVQHAAQRLLLRLEPERCARRRPLPERHRLLRRVGQHLLRRGRAFRGRLDRRVCDSAEVDLVRSAHGHLGTQLLARRRAQEREHRLGLAQPRVQPGGVRLGRGLRRARPARARRRDLGQLARDAHRRRRHGQRLRAVARLGLQDHAADERLADVQHGLLGHRGRRPASQSHALRPVLSRRSATSSYARPTSSSSAVSARSKTTSR